VEFRSITEEVAVGTLVGGWLGSFVAMLFGAIVGALGAKLGNLCGLPALTGSTLVVALFWLIPLWVLISPRPLWRFVVFCAVGLIWISLLQWHVHERDIGAFYPWVVMALPFGIVLGAYVETIRLARGGSTKCYRDPGGNLTGAVLGYGNNAYILAAGGVVGLIADILSLGCKRFGAPISGLLAGGLTALTAALVVAWRGHGDEGVSELCFGSVWYIVWAGTALGAINGAISGHWARRIRETASPPDWTSMEYRFKNL
jgi:hypothetical protein